jgi:hypothetical protein
VESGDSALLPVLSKRKQGTLVVPLHTTWMPVFSAGDGAIAGACNSCLLEKASDAGAAEVLPVTGLVSAAGVLGD